MTDWDARLTVGMRVVVRHRLPVPDDVGHTLTDVVGTLTHVGEQAVTVQTRRGSVEVATASIVAAKQIPAALPRRSRLAGADLAPGDLHRLVVDAWPAMETHHLGDWLLRASRGFTNRANSALAVGSAGLPLAAAIERVEDWYAARRLPANVCLVGPVGFEVGEDPVGEFLIARGYRPRVRTHTLVARTREVAAQVGLPTPGVRTQPAPDARWMAAYADYRPIDLVAAEAILTGSPAQVFADISDEEGVIAIGRLAVTGTWAGVSAMSVRPDHRRQGLATQVLAALVAHAQQAGADTLHLQTDEDNVGALAAYEKVGFRRHHSYVNLRQSPLEAPGFLEPDPG